MLVAGVDCASVQERDNIVGQRRGVHHADQDIVHLGRLVARPLVQDAADPVESCDSFSLVQCRGPSECD